jgi:hypothetical protein
MLQIDWLAGMMNFIANLFMAEGQNWA